MNVGNCCRCGLGGSPGQYRLGGFLPSTCCAVTGNIDQNSSRRSYFGQRVRRCYNGYSKGDCSRKHMRSEVARSHCRENSSSRKTVFSRC